MKNRKSENIHSVKKSLAMSCLVFISVSGVAKDMADIETTADEVIIESKENCYTLSGNAKVKQEEKVFKADKIEIDKSNEKTNIKAKGSVSYSADGIVITSAYCDGNMELVKFSDHVIIKKEGLGTIKADKVTYDVNTKNVYITSNKKVRVIIDESVSSKIDKAVKK